MNKQDLQEDFGFKLRKYADENLYSAYKNIPIHTIRAGELLSLLKNEVEIDIIGLADREYYYTDKKVWDRVVKRDWINKLYQKEKWDCDNFAIYFASEMSRVLGTTVQPFTYGDYDKPNFHDRHYWNTILARENGQDKLYTYEPINRKIVDLGEKINTADYSAIKIPLIF